MVLFEFSFIIVFVLVLVSHMVIWTKKELVSKNLTREQEREILSSKINQIRPAIIGFILLITMIELLRSGLIGMLFFFVFMAVTLIVLLWFYIRQLKNRN